MGWFLLLQPVLGVCLYVCVCAHLSQDLLQGFNSEVPGVSESSSSPLCCSKAQVLTDCQHSTLASGQPYPSTEAAGSLAQLQAPVNSVALAWDPHLRSSTFSASPIHTPHYLIFAPGYLGFSS